MDEHGKVYGSGELTPQAIRNARFHQRGDGYAPDDVHEFLEQVASAMEVLGSGDVAGAMRAELQRNADISSRVVLAGQETAERLRAQAADDARAIIEDTKRLAEQLRDASRLEVDRSRQHIEQMRQVFIDELRDIYDRIGASLYRFESASKLSGLPEPGEEGFPDIAVPVADAAAAPAPSPSTTGGSDLHEHPQYAEPPGGDVEYAQGGEQLAPAWTQLPHEHEAPVEDEPLVDLRAMHEQHAAAAEQQQEAAIDELQEAAAGQPAPDSVLEAEMPDVGPDPAQGEQPVDLAIDAIVEPEVEPLTSSGDDAAPLATPGAFSEGAPLGEYETHGADPGAYLTVADDVLPPDEPPSEAALAAETPGAHQPAIEPEPDLLAIPDAQPETTADTGDDGASWLMAPDEGAVPAEVATEMPPPVAEAAPQAEAPIDPVQSAEDDARAEALLASMGEALVDPLAPPPLPEPPSLSDNGGSTAPDPYAVQQLVLAALHEGQPREAIEGYLRDTIGLADATAFVDQVIAAHSGEQQQQPPPPQ